MQKPETIKSVLERHNPLEIKHERGITIDRKGARHWEDRVFIRLFSEFQEHGFLARLTGNELKVFLSLALRMNVERKAYPSQGRIAKDTGLGITTVKRCLASNNLKSLIDKVQEKNEYGKYKRNVYTILPGWVRGLKMKHKTRSPK